MVPDTAFSGELAEAAVFAGRAPSILNSQPWLWRVDGDTLDLYLQRRRVLPYTDPDDRLAVLSCGAALHHARTMLAAHGRTVTVERYPGPDHDHLARLRLGPPAPPDGIAAGLVAAAADRCTDRRARPSVPLDYDKLRTVGAAIRTGGADLRLLHQREVIALAEAAEQALATERDDPDWQVEVADWVGGDGSGGTGIPVGALPSDPLQLTAPARLLRRAAADLITDTHRRTCVFGVLYGGGDRLEHWLAGGEALSAGWLTATRIGVSVLPLSVVVEVATSRDAISRALGWAGYPYLVLRFATTNDEPPTTRTPRLPAGQTVDQGRDQ